ncbi:MULTISPECIES: imelysin family protein [Marinobacter]|uniref:Imelysin-like domain-containing protein n=1 Tax=Marinobacter profundi TaxID=2666256 RepID=A0A2G1UHJ8_9GAMM|nr:MULTISPECIES: imelysin family protein [Marinobacter]MBD3657721.1 hypothetical protein [Marinobacter sp.]PHQ13981.1 hypothetical protein CLH61_15645 [Marinobacter profundi]
MTKPATGRRGHLRMHRLPALLIAVASAILAACNDAGPAPEAPTTAPTTTPAPALPTVTVSEALAGAVNERATATCEATARLHENVTRFLDAPSASTLTAARQNWQDAHQRYRELVSLYLLAGIGLPQIGDDRDPIDAWPILPGYLDEVAGYPRSGMVFSEVPLTPEFLREEHQSTDFLYLTRGFHPLAVMLDGDGDGAPRHEAFAQADDDEQGINAPQRRADLTRLMSNQLTKDIRVLCSQTEQQQLAEALARVVETLPEPVPAAHEPASEEPGQ